MPLHPEVLSEDAASLLPDAVRPAFVWDLRLDGAGALTSAEVYRAMVRSVERLDYVSVQAAIDAGTDDERFLLLREIGERRIAQERARGGASLPMPEQQVTRTRRRRLHPRVPTAGAGRGVERPGLAAHRHGRRHDDARRRRRRAAHHARARRRRRSTRFRRAGARRWAPTWAEDLPYGEFVRGLDRTNPRHLALIHEATALFRGAGYTAFDGELPEQREHAAVAAPYAHVTAPLRRLVDRFGLVVCEAAVPRRRGAGCRARGAAARCPS